MGLRKPYNLTLQVRLFFDKTLPNSNIENLHVIWYYFGFDPVSLTHSSNGHACALQYSLLHLAGYKISIDDLKAFRVS
jgi:hypothetical protein